MILTSWAPWAAAGAFVIVTVYGLQRDSAHSARHSWLFPAGLSMAFLLFTLQAVLTEGLLGFWPEHTRNLWGNQIWFDLLLAAGIGWFLIVPQARAQCMRLPLWLVLIGCTGCIGFLAMLSRLQYLQARAGADLEPERLSPRITPNRR